ncbi:MAG: TonB-dependent receptor [Burkholderiaceae bacterium]
MTKPFSSLSWGRLGVGMALGLWSLSVFSQTATALPDIEVRAAPAQDQGIGSPQTQLFTGQDWLDQPLSGQVVNQADMTLMGPGRLTDLLRLDSSVMPYYSPVGYYEGFLIRGFAVDPVLGIRVNGVPVVGESRLNMQNKQQVQTLRGPAGAWAGAGTSAGLINLVTERPRHGREVYLTAESRASLGAGIDLGQVGPEGGWRLNAAIDHLRPEARGADGGSGMVSLAFDRPLGFNSVLEMDVEYSRHSQRSQPGSQLLGGTALPPLNPKLVLGRSDWSKPVVFDSLFTMGRITHAVDSDFKLIGTASLHRVKTDDRSSFPWGCSASTSTLAGTYFCSNGDFTLWDYQSLNEKRDAAYLALDGLYTVGHEGITHNIAFGASYLRRTTSMPRYMWDVADTNNNGELDADFSDYADTGNVFNSSWTGGTNPSPFFSDTFDQVIEQLAIVAHDRLNLRNGDTIAFGGRWVQHKEELEAQFPFYPIVRRSQDKTLFLPSLTYSRSFRVARAFIGYRQDLEAGQRAPLSSANYGEVLSPRRMHSYELGLRLQPNRALAYEATAFYTYRPFNFRLDAELNDPLGPFVQQGKESRLGLELGARGTLSQSLTGRLGLTAMQAKVSGTSQAAVNGSHALNTPKLSMNGLLAYKFSVSQPTQVSLVWNYVGKRPATTDGRVELPSYHRFDIGLLQERSLGGGAGLSLRFYVENLFDKAYWRDAADFLGDGYLTAGTPRTFKLGLTLSQ